MELKYARRVLPRATRQQGVTKDGTPVVINSPWLPALKRATFASLSRRCPGRRGERLCAGPLLPDTYTSAATGGDQERSSVWRIGWRAAPRRLAPSLSRRRSRARAPSGDAMKRISITSLLPGSRRPVAAKDTLLLERLLQSRVAPAGGIRSARSGKKLAAFWNANEIGPARAGPKCFRERCGKPPCRSTIALRFRRRGW